MNKKFTVGIIGNCYLDKNNQDSKLKKSYSKEFELD